MSNNKLWECHRMISPEAREMAINECGTAASSSLIQGIREKRSGFALTLGWGFAQGSYFKLLKTGTTKGSMIPGQNTELYHPKSHSFGEARTTCVLMPRLRKPKNPVDWQSGLELARKRQQV